MLCQCAKLTPLQSRFVASLAALALLVLIFWSLSNPHFAYAAELEWDGSGASRSGGEDHNWHRIAEEQQEMLESDHELDSGDAPSSEVYARAPVVFTIGGNNNANPGNIRGGDTVVWEFPQVQLMGPRGVKGVGLPKEVQDQDDFGAIHSELRKRDLDPTENKLDGLETRQNDGSRQIYVSINTCSQPEYAGGGTQSEPPPQLTLFVSTEARNREPGPNKDPGSQARIPLDEGYANFTTRATGNWYMSVHAPDLSNDFQGTWDYEIAVSIDDYFHTLGNNGTNLFLVDSDSNAALLVTNNLTQADSSARSYQEWLDLTPPFILFANDANDMAMAGLQKSYCGLNRLSKIIGDQADLNGQATNVQMEMITRGLGQKPKEQFYVTNLDRASKYTATLAQPGNSTMQGNGIVGGGGKIWEPVSFATKSDGNCALLFNLDFCDQVAYAVPSSPEAVADAASFSKFWDNYTLKYYQNFNYSLQQIPCDTTPDAQYSLVKNCGDCARAYKQWLCAVSIPRCEDFSNDAAYLQVRNVGQKFINGSSVSDAFLNKSFVPMSDAPTLQGSLAFQQTFGSSVATNRSRNQEIDTVIKPGPYKEVLPCEDLCYSLVQSCPAALSFGCPYPGRGLEVGYGTRDGLKNGILTCSYLGAYVYTDAAVSSAPSLWLVAGVVGLLSLAMGL